MADRVPIAGCVAEIDIRRRPSVRLGTAQKDELRAVQPDTKPQSAKKQEEHAPLGQLERFRQLFRLREKSVHHAPPDAHIRSDKHKRQREPERRLRRQEPHDDHRREEAPATAARKPAQGEMDGREQHQEAKEVRREDLRRVRERLADAEEKRTEKSKERRDSTVPDRERMRGPDQQRQHLPRYEADKHRAEPRADRTNELENGDGRARPEEPEHPSRQETPQAGEYPARRTHARNRRNLVPHRRIHARHTPDLHGEERDRARHYRQREIPNTDLPAIIHHVTHGRSSFPFPLA